MKLINKKTGEIGLVHCDATMFSNKIGVFIDNNHIDLRNPYKIYTSLAELNEEWEDMPEEEWRGVLGFEELYQVSNFGNVRTVKNGEAEMSQQENRNGYMTVHLRNKGVERRAMVHRLVAEAFIPNPDELRDVNHKNGDKSDNRVENLEWASHSDNMTHSFRDLGKNVRHIVQLDLDNNFIERWNSIIEASEATGICRTDIGECCRGNRNHTKGYKWKYEEDYEEPKEYWYVDYDGGILCGESDNSSTEKMMISMGNHFESLEEAEKAVEKLKAWKRLEDKGFFFDGRTTVHDNTVKIRARVGVPFLTDELTNDLDLLFSGEDD